MDGDGEGTRGRVRLVSEGQPMETTRPGVGDVWSPRRLEVSNQRWSWLAVRSMLEIVDFWRIEVSQGRRNRCDVDLG
jgi:hypothetical protein